MILRYVCVDIETDGPSPADHSMVELGATFVDSRETFHRVIQRLPDKTGNAGTNLWLAKETRLTNEVIANGVTPSEAMTDFAAWLTKDPANGRITMVADNAGFDWMFVCWYFHHFLGTNVLGHSCLSLTSLYKGVQKDMRASFKHLRQTKHSHNALDDALGNAEAFRTIIKEFRNDR
jgi:DNA polymerase III alpha subunit (gram-positive type)